MTDFSFSTSMAMMVRTAPFVILRVIVYLGIALAYVLVTGTGAGVGWGIGLVGGEEFRAQTTAWGAIIGVAATSAVLYFLREYILYMVKAGHIAVMVEFLQGKDLPEGRGQIDHAQTVVKERFGQANALFALDQLIKGVLKTVLGLVQGVTNLLPIPGLDGAAKAVRAFLKVAVGLLDEVILGHLLRSGAENPWSGGRDALVLYGQNAKPLLKNAAIIALASWALSFVVFLVMLGPAALVVWLIPGSWSGGGLIFAIIFAWAVKAALIEPFAIACLLQAFFKVTEGQEPDPDWSAKLDSVSEKFREMGEKAAAWVGAKIPQSGAAPDPQP